MNAHLNVYSADLIYGAHIHSDDPFLFGNCYLHGYVL